MRVILFLGLLLATTAIFAERVTCYSNGKLIYSGKVESVNYVDYGTYNFVERKSQQMVFINGDCIIKFEKNKWNLLVD